MTGVTCMMVGSGGSGDTLVLNGANEFKLDIPPATVGVGYQLTSGGKEQSGTGDAFSILYNDIGDWVTPTSNANLYEARATVISGAVTTGTTGSWLTLGTTRTWTVTQTTVGASAVVMTVEIRRIGGSTILATGTVNLTAELS